MKTNNKNLLILLLLFSCFFYSKNSFSQDVDIVPYLKQIENGNTTEVREALITLKKENPTSPSVIFLDGVLTENGQEAVVKYQHIVDTYPRSKYADAALYRIYSYYYALGLYETANEKLTKLTTDYPQSPYIQVAKKNKTPLDNKQDEEKNENKPSGETKNTAEYRYTIQAGAFSNLDNANLMKNNFDQAGIFSEVRDKSVGGSIFHVVYAGKFITEQEAKNFLEIVNSRFNLNAIVVPITWN
ncbi:MAG TPA: SPOR domain-containing protein [Ignavibacteriaceae bacterium]|jgi:hypothetical protein